MSLPEIDFLRPGAWWLLAVLAASVVAARLLRLQSRSRLQDGLRTSVLLLLIVTLTGPMLVAGARETTTIFVVDRSASVQTGAATSANDWITSALSQADVDANSAIISFGSEPALSQPVTPANSMGDAWQDVTTMGDSTDLASALSLARSLPVGDNRRIVVLSDGEETTGSAIDEAARAGDDGVLIDVVPLSGIDGTDMRIETVTGPASTWQGEDVALVVQVGADGGGVVTLDLFVDGNPTGTSQVTLQPGSTIVQLTVPAPEPGFHAIAVQVSGPTDIDRIVENNMGYHGVFVRDKPEVLLAAPVGADSTRLQQALEAEGAVVTLVEPSVISTSTADLAAWDAIVLNNVPAWDLSNDQQIAIVAHTEAGNGLIVLGGSASYGPGSYAGTPLEKAMPVTVKVVDGQRRPSVAVLIVMDKSGSMSYDPRSGTTSKIDLAKSGVVTAASALAPGDQLGVIAFNDEPIWALPMMTLTGSGDIGLVEDSLAALSADGGTELYPALQVGYDALRNVDADVRHIILLSDGKSRSGTRDTYQRLVSDLGNDNITLSTVALGTDADLDLLQFLSTNGGGRYHYANTPEEIPQITFQEAQNAGSQSVLRGAFGPVQEQASPILNDIDVTSMPPIDGYNFAEGRSSAQVDLVSDRGDPLLAKWQLGLGRVVAWTADDGSDYASGWAMWDQYDAFWGETLRWTLPDPSNQAITSSISRDGSTATVTLDTQLAGGDAIVLTEDALDVTNPDGTTGSVAIRLMEPGLYEGTISDPLAGPYLFSLPTRDVAMTDALPVSPEWLPVGTGPDLLATIANRSGGNVLSLDEPATAELFSADADGGRAPGTVRAIWPYPLMLALGLFVLEIGLRQSRLWHDQSRTTPSGSSRASGG